MVHDRFTDIAQIINLKIPLNSRGLITFPAKSDIEDYDLLKGGNLYPPNIRMCTNIRCIAWILDFTPYNELEFTSWLHLVTQSFVIGVGSPLSRKFVMMAKSFLFVSPTHKPRPQLNSVCIPQVASAIFFQCDKSRRLRKHTNTTSSSCPTPSFPLSLSMSAEAHDALWLGSGIQPTRIFCLVAATLLVKSIVTEQRAGMLMGFFHKGLWLLVYLGSRGKYAPP